MKKHLILVLALALVAGLTVGAYAEVQNVKVSGDLNVLALGRQLGLGIDRKAETTMASIARVRIDADLTDNVMATVRLINERYWGDSVTNQNTTGTSAATAPDNTNIDLDLAYVTLKEFLYSPLTLTVGRQELHFGNDMIVGDAYTNNHASSASVFNDTIDKDLSMRKSFDAVRATLNYDPLVVDVVAAQISKSSRDLPGAGAYAEGALIKDDQETLAGINANYTVNKTTNVEAYYWQKRLGKDFVTSGVTKEDKTNVIGARVVTKPIDNLTYQLEGAYQFGKQTVATGTVAGSAMAPVVGLNRRAFAIETAATYDLKDTKEIGKYKPTVTALYAFFSGDKGSTSGTSSNDGKKTTAWDPMYENQKFGDIANALFNQSNAHVAGAIVTMKPVDDVTLKGEYYAYWWDKKFTNSSTAYAVATGEALTMTNKKFAGQEVDLTATYDYTEDVQFALLGGWLVPGSSFSKANRNTAGEVIGSMKVTF